MQSLINDYSGDKELEIRCKLNNQQIIQVYDHFIKSSSVKVYEKSLNILKTNKRKEIYYNNKKEKINELHISKKRLHYIKIKSSRNFNAFISLASEDKIDKFSINSFESLRFKNRVSFMLNKKWRLDITHVKTINTISNITDIKNEFLNTDIYKDNVINTKMLSSNSILELEFEYTGTKKDLNILEDTDTNISIIDKLLFKNDSNLIMYSKIIYELSNKIELNKSNKYIIKTLKQLGNQSSTLDFSMYKTNIFPHIDKSKYYITDKADGERCFIFIKNDIKIITTDVVIIPLNTEIKDIYIFDCEKVDNIIYIFDILYHNKNLSKNTLTERLTYLETQKTNINNIEKTIKNPNGQGIIFDFKHHYMFNNDYKNTIKKLISKKKYEIDGLIFTENANYHTMKTYKWKMPNMQTIDFLVLKPLDKMLNVSPYIVKKDHDLLLLFNTISLYDFQKLNLSHIKCYNEIVNEMYNDKNSENKHNKNIFPFAFQPLINTESYLYYHPRSGIPIDTIVNQICEFGCDNKKWDLKRIRHDRKQLVEMGIGYGNYYTVAEDIYKFFLDPFPVEKLLEPENYESKGYFTYSKTNKYKNMIKFNSFVKANLIQFLENSKLVIDLACGKGQDLFTMHGMGIENMIMVDIDLDALLEINNRKNHINDKNFYTFIYKPADKYSIKTLHLDVIADPDKTISEIKKLDNNCADGVVINLAIHYMLSTQENINDIVKIIDSILSNSGVFIFTCFDGKKIEELLKDVDENKCFDIIEDGVVKYSIKKLYKNSPHIGSKIGVKHHFSESYYDENLVFLDAVLEVLYKNNFTLIKKGSFGNYLDNFETFNKTIYDRMSDNDKIYSSLYSYVMVSKK